MINTVALMGRLTYEPELKVTPSGISVIRFQIAVDRQFQAKGQERQADFIDCQAWRQTAEFISKYFHKGDMIALVGSIQTDNFTDKNGEKRKSVTVVANNVSFCGSKSESGNTGPSYSDERGNSIDVSYNTDDFEEIVDDDDLPF